MPHHSSDQEQSPPQAESAWDWLLADRHPKLLPTPWLHDSELEDLVEALLFSERLLGSETRRVQHIERWGVSGDKQDGIDFFGRFNDGTPAAWQVKQLRKLSRADVQEAVKAMTFEKANELYLVYGGIATIQARKEVLEHDGWTLIDRRTLTEMLRLLPTHAQQDIIQRFWGPEVRRHFVTAPGDTLIPFEQFRITRLNSDALLNDCGELAGRGFELAEISRAIEFADMKTPQLLVLNGPGGRGKTRLLVEALTAETQRDPSRAIFCVSPGRVFDAAAMKELTFDTGILVVDDAHNDPPALDPLFALVRNQPNLKLILCTRPSGLPAIRGAMARASFGPDEDLVLNIGELDIKSARKLVKGLTSSISVNFGLRNYIAEQARHSPHVAVILTNLIRKGQISGSIAGNGNLRRVVLARYQEVMIPEDFGALDPDAVHRTIATYACLQPETAAIEDSRAKLAAFCGLSVIQLAQLTRQLIDRGVVLDQEGRLRVVPDVLADQIVEDVAVVEFLDTGFVAELWNTFGPDYYQRLAITLGELDWRIAQRRGPAIMSPVWEAIREKLNSPCPSTLVRELERIAPLAATQPVALVDALETVRLRLDRDDASQMPELDDPEDEDDEIYRIVWPHSRFTTRADVRAKLPKLYGRAAIHESKTLETAVNALLTLACADLRPSHSHPEHARRVLSDDLSNLAVLPDLTYPGRIVNCVKEFCSSHDDAKAVVALSALKPLLAKEELETTQSALYEVSFKAHLISQSAMRPVRDQIRSLLLEEGVSSSLERTGVAIDLLHKALQAPHGYFGATVNADAVLSWENDDLASLSSLKSIAERTQFVTIRRSIRNAITWTAEHAESLPLQHAALSLQYLLDFYTDIRECLADRVMGSHWKPISAKLAYLPTMEELRKQRDCRRDDAKQLTEDQKAKAQQRILTGQSGSRRDQILIVDEKLAYRLLDFGDSSEIVELLGEVTAEARQLGKDPSFRGVWQAILQIEPALAPELVTSISCSKDTHPLDPDLPVLLSRWSHNDLNSTLTWAEDAVRTGRNGVKFALASFIGASSWAKNEGAFTRIWREGSEDSDPRVSEAFLGNSGWYLDTNPIQASAVLLAHELTSRIAANALTGAWRFGHDVAPIQRDETEQSALLSIAARAGLDDFVAQEVVTAAAYTHPELVLDFLFEHVRRGVTLPTDIRELGDAFDKHVVALSNWLADHLQEDAANLGLTLRAALNDQLTSIQALALSTRVPELTPKELITLVRLLASLRLWVPSNLELASLCASQADGNGVLEQVLPELRRGMSLSAWGWVGSESEELTAARDACVAAMDATGSSHLREQLSQSADWFQHVLDELRGRERDEDW